MTKNRQITQTTPRKKELAMLVLFAGLLAGRIPSTARQNSVGQGNSGLGSITGRVKAASGPLTGARITLRIETEGPPLSSASRHEESVSNISSHVVTTDAEGHFTFADVPAGTYTLEVESPGYRRVSRAHVVVANGARAVADVTLGPERSGDEFRYDASAPFKPSTVNAAVDPGGYSAAKDVDSYSLMLDYVQSELGALDHAAPGAALASNIAPAAKSPFPPNAAGAGHESESLFLEQGSDLLLHHDPAAAVASFQAGVVRFPASARLATGLGIALLASGSYQKSIASLLRATNLSPSDPRPYLVLAKAYLGSPQYDGEVLKKLARVVTLDPQNPQAPYYYALALEKPGPDSTAPVNQSDAQKVEPLLKTALTLDPNFAEAHLQLGILYASHSSYPEAIREYRSAVRLKPSLAAAHYRLSQAYNRIGDKGAAQVELDTYQRLRHSGTASAPSGPPP